MNHDTLADELLNLVIEITGTSVEKDTNLLDDDVIDSFAMLAIINYLEETLGIEIDPEDATSISFATVDTIACWGLNLQEGGEDKLTP